MNLFEALVNKALNNNPDLVSLKIVVEKELLHYDILRIMRDHNYLKDLTFIGGTCLRDCYGAIRLSEDLDFAGGFDFYQNDLKDMGIIIQESLEKKYGLKVAISEPLHDKKNVNTWKIKIQTRPSEKHIPAQCINIDICALPAYEKTPTLLLNNYGIDMGIGNLIIQAESRQEIYADKLIAFALRPNRISYRDLWDIMWLHSKNIKPNLNLINPKLNDRKISFEEFSINFKQRLDYTTNNQQIFSEFKQEMLRFLPLKEINATLTQNDLWDFIVNLLKEYYTTIQNI